MLSATAAFESRIEMIENPFYAYQQRCNSKESNRFSRMNFTQRCNRFNEVISLLN